LTATATVEEASELADDGVYSTEITSVSDGGISVRGVDLSDVILGYEFTEMVRLVLGLELSDEAVEVLRACLVTNADHGLASNATTAATAVAATHRRGVIAPIAAGMLASGEATISPRTQMTFLLKCVADFGGESDLAAFADRRLAELKASGERVPGYGSPVHPDGDPRVATLREVVERAGLFGNHCQMFIALGDALTRSGKRLPPNDIGMIAACLADIGITPDEGEAIAMISIVPSLAANALLELKRPPRFLIAREI
jgi:citrate synthase